MSDNKANIQRKETKPNTSKTKKVRYSSDEFSDAKEELDLSNDKQRTFKYFRLDHLIETNEIQITIIVFIILDSFSSFFLAISNDLSPAIEYRYILETAIKFLQSFCTFSVFLFTLEMITIILSFHLKVLTHLGYLLDAVIIALQLYHEINGLGGIFHLLNLFRLWRLSRLFTALVDIEKDAHEITIMQLQKKEEELLRTKIEVEKLKEELKSEQETKKLVESALIQYKEEVDTLNEALSIAAMDIAEVAQADDDEFYDDDDEEEFSENNEEGDDAYDQAKEARVERKQESDKAKEGTLRNEDDDESVFLDTASSPHESIANKTETRNRRQEKVDSLYRVTVKDEMLTKKMREVETFIVQSDGSYKQRKY